MITCLQNVTITTTNMSCIDSTTCTTDQTFNNINCNFTIKFTEYICNPTYTCQRTDGLYDCCASNIADCIIERHDFQLLPTISPTLSPNVGTSCEVTCELAPSTNKCYWYESQNLDISCIGKDNNYCCSHRRDNCCQTSILQMYIVFGSLLLLLIGYAYYKYIVYTYTRIVPDKTTTNTINNNNTLTISADMPRI